MMRRLWIVLAAAFALTTLVAVGGQAATGTKSKSGKMTSKQKATAKVWATSKSSAARTARGPAVKKNRKPSSYTRYSNGTKYRCYRVKPVRRVARRVSKPATVARGPAAPVINVPQQPAPVVNIPQQPAPVVNVPPCPMTAGVTVDECYIYIVQNNQLMVIDKKSYCLKTTVPLHGAETTDTTGAMTGAGPMLAPTEPTPIPNGALAEPTEPITMPSGVEAQPSVTTPDVTTPAY